MTTSPGVFSDIGECTLPKVCMCRRNYERLFDDVWRTFRASEMANIKETRR